MSIGAPNALTITPVTTSPYTAGQSSSIFTIYNVATAAFDFYLPASPAPNQVVVVVDAELTASTYAITVHGNGNNIIAYDQTSASIQINSSGGSVSLAWDGTNWVAYA